ncbi:MAG: B12-binding domain-containing radical SAM protein [Candidatus Scalindua sp.]|nr:B12-binding domain-containing radical SAM protein [Candidatus Scalindua sp.]
MNVLLLSMPDTAPHFNGKRWKSPNLAISSIAGNIKNHNVFVADLVLRRHKIEQSVLELLRKYTPSVVGLSAMSFQFETSRKIAQIIKDENREIKTALGGYHATLMYDEIAGSDCAEQFDFLVRGEGDLSFSELLEAHEQKRDIRGVSGISYKINGKFVHNSPRPLENLDDIKLPARAKRVYKGYRYYGFTLDIVETSRGCTMPCNFCSIDKMYGKSFREYSIDRVMKDIGDAKKYGANFIIIADDNFSLNVKRFEDICDAIVASGHNDIRYIIQASSAGIASSETLAEKMARAGFRIVFLGIENVSKENLKNLQKGNIIEKTKIAVNRLHDQGIMIVGGMIIGHPNDKEENIAENYEFFVGLDIDFFADQILTPYPKTPLREEMIEKGLVTNKYDYSRYNCFWANIKTNYLTPDELQFLRWKYNKKYADYICTTRAFIKNYPAAYYFRTYCMRPYRKLKNCIFQKKLTQRELYREDMNRAEEMNKFF